MVFIIVICAVLYIMFNGIGLNKDMDFGAGAYYYADIPNFEKYTEKSNFVSNIPKSIYILLFLVWGVLMYYLWTWIDKRKK